MSKDCIEIYYKQGTVECHRIYTWPKGCSTFHDAEIKVKEHLIRNIPNAQIIYTDVRILWELE